MTEAEIFDRLKRRNQAELDEIQVRLGLDRASLLGRNEPPASRAYDILEQVKKRGEAGLTALAALLGGPSPSPPAEDRPCLLILSANPGETEPLRLDEEIRLIEQRLAEAEAGKRYRVVSERAVRVSDLSLYLLQHNPEVVHFSGHGSGTGEIVLEDDAGNAKAVSVEALGRLFGALGGKTRAVVLNACYTQEQADALVGSVDYVVGMTKEIGDPSALRFAGGFYRALAFAPDIRRAVALGSVEIALEGLPDAVVPRLSTRHGEEVVSRAAATGTGIELVAPQRTWQAAGQPVLKDDPDAPRLYPVWYATNRAARDPNDLTQGYSGERDPQRVHYGFCKVAVPKSHRIGSVGSSWLKRIRTWTDDRLKLVEQRPLAQPDFWAGLRGALGEWDAGERLALVFVHGFNVSFTEAAVRAAQIGADLKVPGVTAFYSWPSKGTFGGYLADEATIEASEAPIGDFLTRFVAESGAERVHLIAHSMGSRALLRSLERIAARGARAARVPFGQVFLAAPDVDAESFRRLAPVHATVAERTTLYVSAKDKALASSGLLRDYPRAGYTPPVTVVPGIDTVEVSNVDLTFLGHGYYSAARDLLHDLHDLLLHNSAPAARHGLISARTSEGEPYWVIGA